MHLPRASKEYLPSLEPFLDFAFANSNGGNEIVCPCKKCINAYWQNREVVHDHLICEGFMVNYVQWIFHGEQLVPSLPVRREEHNMNSGDSS